MSLSIWVSLFCGEAMRGVQRHTLRSALAALGITIGTAAVVCVVSIGRAGSLKAEAQLASLGDNFVWVEAGGRNLNGVRTGSHGTTSLTLEDARAILQDVPQIRALSPQVDGNVLLAYGDRTWTTHYRGEGADYTDIKRWPLAAGAPLTEAQVDQAASVCILGQTVRGELFGPEDPVGKEIRLGTQICQVIGVLSVKGQSATGWDQDDTLLLPYTTVQKKLRGRGYDWLDDILCSAVSPEAIEPSIERITALLRQRHHIGSGEPDDFNIRHPEELIKAEISAKHTLALFLVSVAAVSLLVGGIGVMNVMLASVAERTREIGVRLAVGAKDWAVQMQFLGEAVMLSLFGGLAGVVLGCVSSFLLGRSLGWPLSIPPLAVVASPAFSMLVGIFFGFYPARRAARLDPIAALHCE